MKVIQFLRHSFALVPQGRTTQIVTGCGLVSGGNAVFALILPFPLQSGCEVAMPTMFIQLALQLLDMPPQALTARAIPACTATHVGFGLPVRAVLGGESYPGDWYGWMPSPHATPDSVPRAEEVRELLAALTVLMEALGQRLCGAGRPA